MTLPKEENSQSTNLKLARLRRAMSGYYNVAAYVKAIIKEGFDINCSIQSTHHLESKQPELIGCTPLHLAFLRHGDDVFLELLNCGADYTLKNRDGMTVLHQVLENYSKDNYQSLLRLKSKYATLILSAHRDSKNFTNPCNNYGLSHFHAACLSNDANIVKSFLEHGVSVNHRVAMDSPIFPGYTPLHFAVRSYGIETVNILINFGADVHSKDAEGKTPLHVLLEQKTELSNTSCCYELTSSKKEASLIDCERVINLLLQHESDCEILSSIHFTRTKNTTDILESQQDPSLTSLCRRLNEVFDDPEIIAEFQKFEDILVYKPHTKFYEDDKKILRRLEKNFALTKLHLACYQRDMNKIERLLMNGQNLNPQVHMNSPIWPGWTPLHILVVHNLPPGPIFKLLKKLMLKFDTSLKDSDGETAIYKAFRRERKHWLHPLLKRLNCTENPVCSDGISHFHIACAVNKFQAVKKFLQNGKVDVNATIDAFWNPQSLHQFADPVINLAGQSPLHLALTANSFFKENGGSMKVVDLLLKYGANLEIKDIFGETPIYKAARRYDTKLCVFKRLIEAGADVNAMNIFGETPLDVLLATGYFTQKHLEIFVEHGCRFNVYDPINERGCTSHAFKIWKYEEQEKILLNVMKKHPHLLDVDEKGRNIVHNLVANSSLMTSNDFVDVITHFLQISGCDVDDQDYKGRTALHFASHHGNSKAIRGLLKSGANINYLTDTIEDSITCFDGSIDIAKHLKKLVYLGFDINEKTRIFSESIILQYLSEYEINMIEEWIQKEIEKSKTIKICDCTSLTLYNFMVEINPKVTSAMRKSQDCIDRFFEDFTVDESFRQLRSVFRGQYRKALARPNLIEKASIALHNLSGCPFECVEFIVILLINDDLKSLIKADQSENGCDDH